MVQKFGSGRMVFDMQTNNLNATINEVVVFAQKSVSEKGLKLTAKLDDSLQPFIFDKDRIIQVVINLINNATKFTDKGSICLSTLTKENSAEVLVADTGCGMKKEEIPRVFEKFEQLKNARERKSGGTGLGLSIAKDIVVAHGGEISVDSELGRGTTFHFTLPFHPPETTQTP